MAINTIELPRIDAANRSLLINQSKQTQVQNPALLYSTFQLSSPHPAHPAELLHKSRRSGL